MKFEIYKDEARQWRWRLQADNNKNIANGGEGFNNYSDMMHSIDLVKEVNVDTPVEVVPQKD